jgi:hypothetical protein
MNFFSRIFGSKKEKPQSQETEHDVNEKMLFTNAPADWPPVSNAFLKSNKKFTNSYDSNNNAGVFDKRMFMVNSLVLIGGINQYLKNKSGTDVVSSYQDSLLDYKLPYGTSMCIDKVLEKGIMKTNGVVIDNNIRYAVLLFTEPVSLMYINKLKNLYAGFDYQDVIYYAQHDPSLIETDNEPVFELFSKTAFTFEKDKQGIAHRKYPEYAVWWSDVPGETFSGSGFSDKMRRYLTVNATMNTYVLGKLSYAFGINNSDNRIFLPDYDEVTFKGPEEVEIILSISSLTGLNFHFPVGPEFVKYREAFIDNYILFCENLLKQRQEGNHPGDIPALSLDWFEELLQKSNQPNVQRISLRSGNASAFGFN